MRIYLYRSPGMCFNAGRTQWEFWPTAAWEVLLFVRKSTYLAAEGKTASKLVTAYVLSMIPQVRRDERRGAIFDTLSIILGLSDAATEVVIPETGTCCYAWGIKRGRWAY
jgi:hypothetical protein